MAKEIEIKFLEIEVDKFRNLLKQKEAKLIKPMRLMKRVVYKTPQMIREDSFLRIRDEGDKITMTYKNKQNKESMVCNEIQIEVSNFEDAVLLLKKAGINYNSFEESNREEWELNGSQITIDVWPWIKPFVEIEAKNEGKIIETVKILGLDMKDIKFGSVETAYYNEYPCLEKLNFRISSIGETRFGLPMPEVFTNS